MNQSTIVGVLVVLWSLLAPAVQAPQVAPEDAPPRAHITGKAEPGEPLVVRGTVFGPDGKQPIAGASVYVYHTDAKGMYTAVNNDNRNPRLRGYMRTDGKGQYGYSTIKPAPYPTNQTPAHIHYVVKAAGYRDRVFEILFEGDPLVSERTRAEAAKEFSGFSIRPVTRDGQGVWQCTQDVRLQK